MTKRNSGWTIELRGEMVHHLALPPASAGDSERWVLVMADEHFDNAKSDIELIKRHHQEAVERNAPILKFGDVFCAMQGKWDPRADQSQLRPELRGNNYLDRLVDYAEAVYSPFANNIALVAPGNHETSIGKRHQTDLTQRFVDRLRRAGSPALVGGYAGFVRIGLSNSTSRRSFDLFYHHGYGGGGEVTRGMIDNNRTRGQYDADIYVSGHIHRRNTDENIITSLNNKMTIERKQQWFVRCGTYKAEEGPNGWHVETGKAARPQGGWWIRFRCFRGGSEGTPDWEVTPIPA
jgi:hypothetical protein